MRSDRNVGDDVADFAKRACKEFSSWDADVSRISLYLVERSGKDVPTANAEHAALGRESLQPTWTLEDARVVPNSCILVRKTAGAAAGGACMLGGGEGKGLARVLSYLLPLA